MGGKAIKESTPVTKEVLDHCFGRISSYLQSGDFGIKEDHIKMIGSGGKKKPDELYGDLDIAVYIGKYYDQINHFFDDLKTVLQDYKNKDMRQIGIYSFGLQHHYSNNSADIIQIDIMPTFHLDWITWSHHSPHWLESKYKGLYRNEVLYAVAKYAEMKYYPTNNWSRYFFDLTQGFMRGNQTNQGKTKILKNPKTLKKWGITTNPDEAIGILFGQDIKSNDILTFEDALKYLTADTFPHKEQMMPILNMIKKGIQSKKVPVPQIFLDIMKKEKQNVKNLDKAS